MKIFPSRTAISAPKCSRCSESGQAFVEFAFVAFMLIAMLFAIIDFGRIIYTRQILVNLSREGANLASRGTDLSNTVAAVIAASDPLDFTNHGYVIVSVVVSNSEGLQVTNQWKQGGLSGVQSRIGTVGGAAVNLPSVIPALPPPNQTLYIAEVFYNLTPATITPIGQLLTLNLPKTNYDIAYFIGL
jgi:TadE-like protein